MALLALLVLPDCGGENLGCGGPFCVVPPSQVEAARLRESSGGGQTGAPGRELPLPLEVLITDEDDRPIADVEVGFTIEQGGGTLSDPAARSDHLGRAQVRWTLGAEAGTQSVRAAATNSAGQPLEGSPLLLFAESVRPPPAKLVLRQLPPDVVQSGILFTRQPAIGVLDADDGPVSGVGVSVAIATGGGTLSGTTTVSTDATGRATFTDLAIAGVSGARTLSFSVADPPLEPLSVQVEVTAGASSQVTGNEPLLYQGIVNSPVSPAPSVVVSDAAGNPVSGAVVVFTADRDGTVSPRSATTNEQGVAQVSSWTLGRTAGTRYSLSALLQGSTGEPIVFSADAQAAPAGGLKVVTHPSRDVRSGKPFRRQPVVQVVDKVGNPVPQAGLPMKATIFSGPAGSLQNDVVMTDAAGLATFTSLTLNGLVGEYRLLFSAPGFVGNTSNPMFLVAGEPAGFRIVAQVSPTARSRVPFSDQPVLQLQDDQGNPVSQAGLEVVASIASGEGTLTGTTTAVTDANGVASFGDLAIAGGPGTRTLRLSSTNPLAEVTTGPVTLPSVERVSVLTAPTGEVVVATRLANPVSWTLEDAEGQPVSDVPVVLSASPGNSVEPVNATSDVNGVIQLQSWTVSQTAGEQTINLEVPGVGSSNLVIEAVAGAASALRKVSGDGQSAPVNSELPQPLIVRVVDQFENGVGGILVQWRTCDGAGNYDAATDAGGFSSAFQATGPEPGTYCGMAASAGLVGSPVQFSFTVTPGTPAASASTTGSRPSRPPAPAALRSRR